MPSPYSYSKFVLPHANYTWVQDPFGSKTLHVIMTALPYNMTCLLGLSNANGDYNCEIDYIFFLVIFFPESLIAALECYVKCQFYAYQSNKKTSFAPSSNHIRFHLHPFQNHMR